MTSQIHRRYSRIWGYDITEEKM